MYAIFYFKMYDFMGFMHLILFYELLTGGFFSVRDDEMKFCAVLSAVAAQLLFLH